MSTANLNILHKGAKSDAARALQAATNRRLRARDLNSVVVHEDGLVGDKTLEAVRKAAWALGAQSSTYERITRTGTISIGVQRMIRNPGHRTPGQQAIARARMSQMRRDRAERSRDHGLNPARKKFVSLALEAASNYTKRPSEYHYLAGGVANLVFLEPSARTMRSDCSQFASSVQEAAGLPPLGPYGPLWVSTYVMAAYLESTVNPEPGDFGMYGARREPFHVECYCALPGREFIGHGSPPIDSLTPGRPDFYLKNPIGA